MIQVAFSNSFKKSFKKRIKGQNEELFFKKMELFIENPYHQQLRTHKLSGKLKDLWSFSLDRNIRVVFYFVDTNHVIFENIGTHDEVY
ncbi:MAG: type II toxin-antitoxin system mRNA interferase toxin, RelE/StbE family [Bacteroidales bacterium]|nr:type II toxin-antitoxin system mRNA interferase toxin, RelE/StbE family [Bacteroidales bacterium]